MRNGDTTLLDDDHQLTDGELDRGDGLRIYCGDTYSYAFSILGFDRLPGALESIISDSLARRKYPSAPVIVNPR
jgi:hypothetical protein